MRTDTPQTIYLKDYTPYPFDLKNVDLNFDLREGETIVTAKTHFVRKENANAELYLFGEDLDMQSIAINGAAVTDYTSDDKGLTIANVPDDFTLEIVTRIIPEENTRLEGLYKSGGNYCTQCEAEGFRRITYFPDRPDVMSTYTVRVEADQKSYPVLLSNGNKTDEGELETGRHFTTWHDPHPKPCYLFALVAGDLNHIHDTFKTASGRNVDLYIYVRPGDEDQCDHAMESLKKSMTWDEDVYGLEYDLDLFNIVAVSDFNMGAMENKSLNIFNTALVLAAQETATDTDFMRVESVIAHEYFHNWSGNRVTCRDWFQLSLKEGLTVFRDQEFSADMHSKDVQRIDDVTHLRKFQFPEDASPLAHPIRPDNYIEINNFYTMTVYEKGAEIIRMTRNILGEKDYRKATDLYFSRHDGQAVTCDDWVKCMEDASGRDLSVFKRWYAQAGTPRVSFQGQYDPNLNQYRITLTQSTPDTAGQSDKAPVHIPVALGLLGADGRDLIDTQTLHLTEKEQSFTIENITEAPVPSVLRGFSAPVILEANLSSGDHDFLARHDSDGFNRWESAQIIDKNMIHALTDQIEAGEKPSIPDAYLEGYGQAITNALDDNADRALTARNLSLPDIGTIVQERENANPENIHKARQALRAAIKRTHKSNIEKIYTKCDLGSNFSIDAAAMGSRALRNIALSMLTATYGTGCAKRAKEHYFSADNMTDRMAALLAIAPNSNSEREEVFHDFYERFKNYPLVMDKWFSAQSGSMRKDLISHLKSLKEHKDFNIKNPNRVRALYAAFAMNNPAGFHAEDGSGYDFLSDGIIELNSINPQIAARLLTPMRSWKSYSLDRQDKLKSALERILQTPNLSPDVFEIASKSLKG